MEFLLLSNANSVVFYYPWKRLKDFCVTFGLNLHLVFAGVFFLSFCAVCWMIVSLIHGLHS